MNGDPTYDPAMTSGPQPPNPYANLPRKGLSPGVIAAIVVGVIVVGCFGLGLIGIVLGSGDDNDVEVESTAIATTGPTTESTTAPSSAASTADECAGITDVTSTQPLCDFRDSESYPYRVALAASVDEVLPAVQAIAPWTEATNLTDLYGACDDLAAGSDRAIDNAVTRFSGAPDEQVSREDAAELLAIAEQYICP